MFTPVPGRLGYLFAGMVDGHMLISLLAGSIPTVVLGSLLSRSLNGRWIQVLLAVVLLGDRVENIDLTSCPEHLSFRLVLARRLAV